MLTRILLKTSLHLNNKQIMHVRVKEMVIKRENNPGVGGGGGNSLAYERDGDAYILLTGVNF